MSSVTPTSSIKLSIKEKISYGLGDAGCNLVWQTVMLFMAYFYTDIYGLSPAHMGTMFLAVRVIDAVADVLMGAVADRTRSRFGQFRPYLLWFAIPFGVLCALTFYTPDFGYAGKLVYAYTSYILLSLVYTAVNVPYCAMVNNLSDDSRERVSLQSYRFAFSGLGGLFVSMSALPLVAYLGQEDKQQGYFMTMLIMGVLSVILLFTCFKNTRERHIAALDPEPAGIWKDLTCLYANKDWRIMFTLNVVNLIAVIFKGGVAMYYVNSVMKRPDLATPLLSLIFLSGILGALFSAAIFKNIDKVKGFNYSMGIEGVLLIILFFASPQSLFIIFGLVIVINFIQSAATPLQWSMVSDVVDLEESVSGRRLSGMVFSTNLFAIKLGIAIGGALIGWLLAWGGYVGGGGEQNAQSVLTIKLLFTLLPALLVFSLLLIMKRYSLNDEKIKAIKDRKIASSL
ncbi:glycoside-pentoside-hexuronide (GPH):cation symporter [Brenneria corticis]|uniref:MFS transporter n=1 Tax=Brenneria corticis TaxID=2173106 RepID=A0A2U1U7M9_9GAMM|nr:glycoside-pentoside-hexuronide (GPH):cation symporter [Brenneria sp. CFCC 11842]PWC17649.1 MFS transporter [Brenneria sp. CFCC 11842]